MLLKQISVISSAAKGRCTIAKSSRGVYGFIGAMMRIASHLLLMRNKDHFILFFDYISALFVPVKVVEPVTFSF